MRGRAALMSKVPFLSRAAFARLTTPTARAMLRIGLTPDAVTILGTVASVAGALTPKKMLALSPERLRAAGLSAAKAKYVRNLADWFARNPKTAKSLTALSNGAVVEALTTIPGIGIWTANVFLVFSLHRLDVVPASDLGIRRGVQLAYGLPSLATPETVKEKARRWRPYQSIASMYLWNAVKLKIGPESLR